jgi:transcriptional regulator with XRE-family HTH domain
VNILTKNPEQKHRPRFRELRESKGTLKKVATDTGLTETAIRDLEKGRTKPTVANLFAFARYFETDVYDLWPDLANEVTNDAKT